jgi:small conductance mechanosensitive channel
MTMDFNAVTQTLIPALIQFGLKVLGAVVVWVVARRVIRFGVNVLLRSLKYPFDQTVAGYIATAVSVLLNIALILGILGFFGIETTSLAALMAGVGIAVGAAWGGLLANLAAGVFILILRPFKVGDFISGGGVIGTVDEIGLFVTTITTMDNVRTFVGNNKLFSDNVQNFTANPWRRVDLVAQLDNSVSHADAIQRMKQRLARIPNVLSKPAPDVEVLSFTPLGPVLAVRPYCHNNYYWQVYFDTNRAIAEVGAEAGFPPPQQHVRLANGGR